MSNISRKNNPIKHHYIPQFILRNFCFPNGGKQMLYYYDINTRETSKKDPQSIFMQKNLYTDSNNHPTDDKQIEKDLSKFEGEIAVIIKNKILADDNIEITIEENNKIKLFFATMKFRNINTENLFKNTLPKDSQNYYKHYQPNEDYEDFWKRNLGRLVNYRSIKEVIADDMIDEPIKAFMCRDTGYLDDKNSSNYLIVAKSKGYTDFVIGDMYPARRENYFGEPFYEVFPLSNKKALLLVYNLINITTKEELLIDPFKFQRKVSDSKDYILIPTINLDTSEVNSLNNITFKTSKNAIAFKDKYKTGLDLLK